jgi:membrane-associated protein
VNWIKAFLHFLSRLTDPQTLSVMTSEMGPWVYVLMVAIIFCETGLVILPFLPGDSLLFALGALGALPGIALSLPLMAVLLIVAAILGDALNYAIGRRMGPAVFHNDSGRWLNRKHLQTAHAFYEKYGGKTIILARFVPIVRTFAPFVAGIGEMTYRQFALYNVVGAVLWVGSMMGAGRLFGGIPWVQRHFEAVILAIIVISVLPGVIEVIRARRRAE